MSSLRLLRRALPRCGRQHVGRQPRSVGESVPRGLAAVDVQDHPRDEWGVLEIEDPFDDVADLANSAQRMEVSQALIRSWREDRVLYDPEGDGVDPHAARGVLDGQRAGHGCQPTFGERYKGRR